MTRDIAALIMDRGMGLSLDEFRGRIVAAEMLGHPVTIREIRDPGGNLHSIIATCEVPIA